LGYKTPSYTLPIFIHGPERAIIYFHT
jgi:hypothetical protein